MAQQSGLCSPSDSEAAAFHIKQGACTRSASGRGLGDRFLDLQTSLPLVISDGPSSLGEATAVEQLGPGKPGQRPSRTRGFLLGSQGRPGGHVVLVKMMLQVSRFEGFREGCRAGDPPAPHGLRLTQWGLCSPAPHWGRAVGMGGEGGQALGSWGNRREGAPALSAHSPVSSRRGTRKPLWAGAVRTDGSQLCSIFVKYFWLS